jgi:hypothetical protein
MSKTLAHLGSQVTLNFVIVGEDGESINPLVTNKTGELVPLFPVVLNVARLDHAAFEELESTVASLRETWTTAFCPEDLPTLEPVEVTPELPADNVTDVSQTILERDKPED